MTEDRIRRILGVVAREPNEDLPGVEAFLRGKGRLDAGETVAAAVDDTWTSCGERGVVLTDRRMFRFDGERAGPSVLLDEVGEVIVRRMWYPGAPLAGRGEVFGKGPVVVLRFRFRTRDGRTVKFRLQDFAAHLLPFVEALVGRFGDRLRRAMTLPGL